MKSTDIKICDLIIDISLQKPLRIMQTSKVEPERCSNMKKHLLCVECKKGLIESANSYKFSFIRKVIYEEERGVRNQPAEMINST